jgi:predicted ATPase
MLIVITGGPSSGKTSVINQLQSLGHHIVEEIARPLINEGVLHPQKDRDVFEREVLRRQLEAEKDLLNSSEIIFLDNSGILDGPPFYTMAGMTAPPEFRETSLKRYALAILLEPLGFYEEDGVRSEDLQFTQAITELLYQDCVDNGLPVVRLSGKLSVEQRVEEVLKQVSSL